MIRALTKGTILWGFGRVPGGPHLYRHLTRKTLGTQATHVDKLARVWTGYAPLLASLGVKWEGAEVGFVEGGWTPFPFLLSYLMTGNGGTVWNEEADLDDRYVRHSVEFALDAPGFEGILDPERRAILRTEEAGLITIQDVLTFTGGEAHHHVDSTKLPSEASRYDLVHSGGTLEHFRRERLDPFIGECFRVLKPGGVASHVFDHRDHLYHADKAYWFLNHLRFSDRQYEFLFGHPLIYHSRLLPAEMVSMFEAAGFETLTVRRRVLPDQRVAESPEDFHDAILGLPREKLSRRFTGMTDEDLRTAAAHYVFRKPTS